MERNLRMMWRVFALLILLFWGVSGGSVQAQKLTDAVIYAADGAGAYNGLDYWTTGGASAGLFLRKGEKWLNQADMKISVPLEPGLHTFHFNIQSEYAYSPLGLSLFFDANTKTPDISVVTTAAKNKNERPKFSEARGRAMRPNIEMTTASATLVYRRNDIVIELTDFRCDDPQMDKPDRVSKGGTLPDNSPDVSGRFTLRVTRRADNEPNPNVPSGRIRYKAAVLQGHKEAISAGKFSPDGKYIMTCGSGEDAIIKLWSAQNGKELFTLREAEPILFAVFSPDGKHLLASLGNSTVKVWDVASRSVLVTMRGHTGQVTGAGFAPDGKRIVTGSLDSTVRIWDAKTGRELLTLKGHSAEVTSVAFSPDGKRVVSTGQDKQALLWTVDDAASKQSKTYLKKAKENRNVSLK